MIVQFTASQSSGADPEVTPAVALFHELVHALRDMMGVSIKQPTCDDFDTREEFVAIFLENILRSELNKKGQRLILRFNHHGFKKLPSFLADPQHFFNTFRTEIMQIRNSLYAVTEELRKIKDVAFNPLLFAP